MRFEVPKFIEVEDKIFGPFTWKQFLYFCGGIGAVLIANQFTQNLFWAFIFSSPIWGIALALVFYKVNGQDFAIILKSAVQYYLRQKLYVWKIVKNKNESKAKTEPTQTTNKNDTEDKSKRLEDINWGLDVLDRE